MENISAVAERIIRFISSAVDVFFSIVISVYILSERKMLGNSLKRFIRSILPVKVSDWLLRFCSVFGKVFSRFMTGQALEAFVLGGMCFLGMLVFKLPYAPVVSVVIGFSNLIPILGAYVGTTFGFLLILMVSPKKAFIFVAFEILLQQVENNLTYPKVVGKTLELSGFWTITAVLVGGALFGFGELCLRRDDGSHLQNDRIQIGAKPESGGTYAETIRADKGDRRRRRPKDCKIGLWLWRPSVF